MICGYVKVDERISNILLQMGATPDRKGFRYIKESVVYVLLQHGLIDSIMKDIYQTVAQQNNEEVSHVERAMRYIITVIWNRGKIDIINKCFGLSIFSKYDKPSNGQFIMILSDKLAHEFYYDGENWHFIEPLLGK